MVFIVDKIIGDDFLNGLIAGQLHGEISDDISITTVIISIGVDDNDVFLKFVSEPNANEMTILDTIISTHVPIIPAVDEPDAVIADASGVLIEASSTEADVGITLVSKGTGVHVFDNVTNASEIRLNDADSNNYTGIKCSDVVTSYTMILPSTQGGVNDVLTNNGSGILSWSPGSIDLLSDNISVSGSPFNKFNFDGFTIIQNAIDSTQVDIGLRMRHFGALASDPVTSATAGEKYFNTRLNHEMFYDASRKKWLSVSLMFEGSGGSGSTKEKRYFERYGNMRLSSSRGPCIGKGTIISIGFGSDTSKSFTYEVLIDGVSVSSLSSGGASSAYSDTLNDDFNTGVISSRNMKNSDSVSNLQASIGYRYRS